MTDKKLTSLSSSLRYPSNTLETCLGKIKILFEKNSKNLLSPEAIFLDLGFSGRNGSSTSIISSLKYYGLLEKDNNKLKISDFITDYCISGKLNHDILFQALKSVPINKKIFSIYDFNNLPSENEIKSFLIKTCNYNLKQATTYIETFNKNRKLYNDNSLNTDMDDKKDDIKIEKQKESQIVKIEPKKAETATITYPLSSQHQISITLPSEIKEIQLDDLEDIKDILELVLKKVNHQIKRKDIK